MANPKDHSTKVYFSTYDDMPFGPISVASTEQGICACFQRTENSDTLRTWLAKHFDETNISHDQEYNRHIADQLCEYFAGTRTTFELTYDMRGTEFQVRVWQELQKIPYGETITYGELARRVGGATYSRAVGGANNKNPIGIIVPCHRVIGSDGKLVGYAGGLEMKNQLLNLEKGLVKLLG